MENHFQFLSLQPPYFHQPKKSQRHRLPSSFGQNALQWDKCHIDIQMEIYSVGGRDVAVLAVCNLSAYHESGSRIPYDGHDVAEYVTLTLQYFSSLSPARNNRSVTNLLASLLPMSSWVTGAGRPAIVRSDPSPVLFIIYLEGTLREVREARLCTVPTTSGWTQASNPNSYYNDLPRRRVKVRGKRWPKSFSKRGTGCRGLSSLRGFIQPVFISNP